MSKKQTRTVNPGRVEPTDFANEVQAALKTGLSEGATKEEIHQGMLDIVNSYFPASDSDGGQDAGIEEELAALASDGE